MRVGDILEWLAGATFVVGTALATSLAWPAVLVGGAFLAYQAQCHGTTPMPKAKVRVKVPHLRRKAAKIDE